MGRILITGATGLVGQAIVKQCHDKGISVNYLSTNKSKIKSLPSYQGFYWNPRSGEIDIECFNDVKTIINLAGTSIAKRWTKSYKRELYESRIRSLQLLFNTIEDNDLPIKQLISASAIGYYPDSLTNFYDENYVSESNSFLSKLVQNWETEADNFNRLELRVAIVRIGIVLSNKGGALAKLVTPIKYFVGSVLGSGLQWQSWIHIQDLASLFMFVHNKNLEGVFNCVAPNPVTQKTLTTSIAKVLRRPLLLPSIPGGILKLVLGEMSTVVLESQRVSSKKIENLGLHFRYHTVRAALEDLLK